MNRSGIMNRFAVLLALSLIVLATGSGAFAASAPTLLFSDLDWGPKTGWEGSTSKGAAVSVWGKNFGSTRGTSFVTVNGAQATEYAEWGAIGPARGLERITFHVPSTAADGAGSITVTVNGVTSNTLPFTVMSGKIYFVSPAGNNSFNGLSSAATSTAGPNGPFRDISKFNPAANPSGTSDSYIVYVRSGSYSGSLTLRGPYGSETNRHALVGFPAETPVFTGGILWGSDWDAGSGPLVPNNYFTVAKLTGMTGKAATEAFGDHHRIIGCTFRDYLDDVWTGVVWVSASKYVHIYGNLFDHNGYDSYKHNIYVKTQRGASIDRTTEHIYIGWNEFSNAVAGSDARGGVIFISKESAAEVAAMPTQNIFIHDNYFTDGNTEFIYVGDSVNIGDVYIYNNIFKGGASMNGGMTFYAGTNNVYLYNNVFYQMGPASESMIWATGAAHLYFKNNIWQSQPGQKFFSIETYKGATFNSDHDLFYTPSTGTNPPSGSGIVVQSPLIGDPLFVVNGYDLHLQSSSPAIDEGTADVSTLVGTDHDGLSRPRGNGYDIGPFEYDGVRTAPPVKRPSNPANLRVH
jgi:hypothetical protein